MIYRRILLAVLTFAAFAMPSIAWAEVNIHVQAGVGDNVRAGAIVPVRVQIINDTENDYSGTLSIAFKPVMGSRPLAWYHREVPMPPGSEKVTYFCAPLATFSDGVIARYSNGSGRQVAEAEGRIRDFGEDRPVLLTVSESVYGLPETKVDGKDVYYRVGCLPADLPRDALGLTMFDAIIISPPPPTPMRADQVIALRDWVLSGGTLIIDASRRTDFLQDSAIAALSPFIPAQQAQVTMPPFDTEASIARGQYDGGEVVLGDADTPLVIRKPYGLGSVTAFAVSPDSPALKRWDGVDGLWKRLLRPASIGIDPKVFVDGVPRQYDNDAQNAARLTVTSGPRNKVRLGIVIILTALYAFAVGPGDYFLVRRLGRPRLTWITFPIIVAVFTAAAYYGARMFVGGDLAQQYQERVRIFADEGVTSRYEIASVFVPVGRRYTINTPDGGILLPLRTDATQGDPIIDVNLDTGAVAQHVPIWTQRYFERRTNTATASPIDFTLSSESGIAVATITNNSETPLTNLVVAYKRGMFKLPHQGIDPGESATIEIGEAKKLDVDQSRASWPREHTVLSGILNTQMAFVLQAPPLSLVNQRDAVLRSALAQGAAILFCDGPVPTQGFQINGDAVAPEGASHIQVITYDGVNL